MKKILCLAGFADGAAMFEPLKETPLAQAVELIAVDLPGFADAAAEPVSPATLDALADWVDMTVRGHAADTIMAHSVASIIASLAASCPDSPVHTLISLEGNLTAEDAYFSGRAAQYDDAIRFKSEFIALIEARAQADPILTRYAEIARRADAQSMWELGCDAHRYSRDHHPGERLRACERVIYVYNPDNCAQASLDWLAAGPFETLRLDGVSHWPTIDAAQTLSERLQAVI